MINFTKIISMSGIELNNYKIHCATGKKDSPLEAFFEGKFKQWQEIQTKKNFNCEKVLSLIHLENDRWLFAGIYKIKGFERDSKGFLYSTEEMAGLEHLTGKAIIQFHKPFRASYLIGPKHEDKLFLAALRDQRMTVGDFPGYNSVLLSYRMLKTIVRESNPSWKSALCNVSGVYLINDTSDGKLYVGSAYGLGGIWQRWSEYAKNGHGGNIELKNLLHVKNIEHFEKFQFSILEIIDINSNENYVIERENHWKNVFKSREFGLNKN